MKIRSIVANVSCRIYSLLPSPKPRSVILISGSPRGGTTWIAESVVASMKKSRLMWEPLQDGNPAVGGCSFSKRPFVKTSDLDLERKYPINRKQEKFWDDLVGSKMWNAHTLRLRKYPGNCALPFLNGPLVVKFVRGNGIVGYLHQTRSTKRPLVIIRNPYAVVASQLKMGPWNDHPHLDDKLVQLQPQLMRAFHKDSTLAERLAITWAADYLAAKENHDFINIYFYENLVKYPEQYADHIASNISNEICPVKLLRSLKKPSSTVHEWTDLSSKEMTLNRWRMQLSENDINLITNVLRECSIPPYEQLLD